MAAERRAVRKTAAARRSVAERALGNIRGNCCVHNWCVTNDAQPSVRLVFSIAEAAEALGVSDDLIYELTARGDLPCVRLGRRKVIPAIAIRAVIDASLDGFQIGKLRFATPVQTGAADEA